MSIKITSSSMRPKTSSFKAPSPKETPMKESRMSKLGHSPDRLGSNLRQNEQKYAIRFRSKMNCAIDQGKFDPGLYLIGQLTIQDVINLKEVFDAYDSTGMGVLLPNDLKLLLTQNGFQPNKKTVYQIVAEFDTEQTGGISFGQFMKAMDTKPYINQTKKQIAAIFKKYDRANKGHIDINDLREINRHLKENVDEQTLKLMLEKADSNHDGKISFEDFQSVMVRTYY